MYICIDGRETGADKHGLPIIPNHQQWHSTTFYRLTYYLVAISHNKMATNNDAVAKPGPEPTLISRRQVDALYEVLLAVTGALNQLDIPYIVTGGSLLGAIRQHSILFCDDDIDLAILEEHNYERAKSQLQSILGATTNTLSDHGR